MDNAVKVDESFWATLTGRFDSGITTIAPVREALSLRSIRALDSSGMSEKHIGDQAAEPVRYLIVTHGFAEVGSDLD